MLASIIVNAQDITTYRGAFAPAPERQWTESWTNFDPQNAAYPATNVTVSGTITVNTTWTSNNTYLLTGVVYVDSLVTLTIEPGTIIRGASGNSSLMVERGGKLIAEGTQCNPIVFTSNAAAGSRAPGQWGGILLLGRAKHNLGTNILIEGLEPANTENYHGGTDDNDNSGTLKYVRIEYGGFIFSLNNEINGLTMGSVGNGTIIDYVQVSFINDDAFEWFGGSVNCKHLIAYRNIDDDFDTDNGYSGTVQYALAIKDPALSDGSQSTGFESDNDNPGTGQSRYPKTSAKFYNVTQIGAFRCASNTAATGVVPPAAGTNHRQGARLRRNTDLKVFNSIFMANWRGLFLDGALALANVDQDSLVYRNNIIAGDFTTTWAGGVPFNGTKSLIAEDAATRSRLLNPVYSNDSVNTCSLLTNAWSFTNADYRPNPAFAGAVTATSNTTGAADLSLSLDIDNTTFTPNLAQDFVVNVFENNSGATTGIITITIPGSNAFTFSVPSTTSGNSDVFGGTANVNSNWNFAINAGTGAVTITSKSGIILPRDPTQANPSVIGLRATRKPNTANGVGSFSLSVSGGGDITPLNNTFILGTVTSN